MITFIMRTLGFLCLVVSCTLAHLLDSLVRVPRRVG